MTVWRTNDRKCTPISAATACNNTYIAAHGRRSRRRAQAWRAHHPLRGPSGAPRMPGGVQATVACVKQGGEGDDSWGGGRSYLELPGLKQALQLDQERDGGLRLLQQHHKYQRQYPNHAQAHHHGRYRQRLCPACGRTIAGGSRHNACWKHGSGRLVRACNRRKRLVHCHTAGISGGKQINTTRTFISTFSTTSRSVSTG